MKRLAVLLAVILAACSAPTHAAPLDPCCPTLDFVTPPHTFVDERAISRLARGIENVHGVVPVVVNSYYVNGYTQLMMRAGVRTWGALLIEDVVVSVWEVQQ
jgi:hypothetical protein